MTKETKETEGVIKFRLEHHPDPPPEAGLTAPLRAWFRVLRRLELLGRRPDRYLGYAYGNLSRRDGSGFLITCTQTSGQERLNPDQFSRVEAWRIDANRLSSSGPCKPSSEALTHAIVYEQIPACRFVYHIHSPEIWRNMEVLELPVTDPAAEYGTPEMAVATAQILEQMGRPASGALGMGGHEDGILSWGETADAAGSLLVSLLARALTLTV